LDHPPRALPYLLASKPALRLASSSGSAIVTDVVTFSYHNRQKLTFASPFIELQCSIGHARRGVLSEQRASIDHNEAIRKVMDTSAPRATTAKTQRHPRQDAFRDLADRERV